MTYAWRKGDYEITRLLDTLKNEGGLLSVHCENGWAIDYLIERALKEGKTGPVYHESTRPDTMEEETSMRVSLLAEMLGAPIYIVHMSSGKALRRVQEIKARGSHGLRRNHAPFPGVYEGGLQEGADGGGEVCRDAALS